MHVTSNPEWCLFIAVILFSFCAGYRAAHRTLDGTLSALGAASFALAFLITVTRV